MTPTHRRRPNLGVWLLFSTAALAACSTDSSTPTTDSFTRAPAFEAEHPADAAKRRRMSGTVPSVDPSLLAAVDARDRRRAGTAYRPASSDPAVVEIDRASLLGRAYSIPVAYRRITLIALPDGEQITNMAYDPNQFLAEVGSQGSRATVALTPKQPGARSDLTVLTDAEGPPYLFNLAMRKSTAGAVRLVDITGGSAATANSAPPSSAALEPPPRPFGAYSRLQLGVAGEDSTWPAWAPINAWADASKLVVTFQTPLPELPALFAGRTGEQQVTYRTVNEPRANRLHLVTQRRVTEAELRLDGRIVTLTDSGSVGTPAPPVPVAAGGLPPVTDVIRQAGTLAPAGGAPPVTVIVLPQGAALPPELTPYLPPAGKATQPPTPVAHPAAKKRPAAERRAATPPTGAGES